MSSQHQQESQPLATVQRTMLTARQDDCARKLKLINEFMAEPQQAHEQLRSSLRRLFHKALLILVLFTACAIFTGGGFDRGIVLLAFILFSAVILFWPASWASRQ